jgi:hypothetical protein
MGNVDNIEQCNLLTMQIVQGIQNSTNFTGGVL